MVELKITTQHLSFIIIPYTIKKLGKQTNRENHASSYAEV